MKENTGHLYYSGPASYMMVWLRDVATRYQVSKLKRDGEDSIMVRTLHNRLPQPLEKV